MGVWWTVWAGATLAAFGGLEAYALASRGKASTLSATFRRVAGLDPWRWWGALTRLGLVAFAAWLVLHLGWGVLPS